MTFRGRVAFFGLMALSGCAGDDASSEGPTRRERERETADAGADAAARPSAPTASKPDAAVSGVDASTEERCSKVELTYQAFADAFFAANCRSCHSASKSGAARSGAPPAVNFDSEAEIVSRRGDIRTAAIDAKRMPPGKPLSDCAIERLDGYLDSLRDAACQPRCADKQCGDDGCDGSCGSCDSDERCEANRCVAKPCEPQCEGASCGPDGCGGTCGTCAANEMCTSDEHCVCVPACEGKQCGPDGCGGSCDECSGGMTCNTATGMCQPTCTPNCGTRVCGDNGCGGSCGSCTGNQTCNTAGICAGPALDFTSDVYPIFAAAGCGNSNCHGGSDPARGLNLSTATLAQSLLVNVAADECGDRLRVAPGAPANSYLINKLMGVDMCAGERMPRGGTPLSTAQIDTIRTWITGLTP